MISVLRRTLTWGVGQGTMEGALISSVNLDNGVREFFAKSEYEVSYGNVPLRPIIYQDDIARLSGDINKAQKGNDKLEALAETKLLDFNKDKSCFIVIGKGKNKNQLDKQLKETPLLFCGDLQMGLQRCPI